MDAICDDLIADVAIMSSSQVGKSEVLLNAVGYFSDIQPSPMLMIQPTLEMAEAFSKDRVAPMIRDTPELAELFGDPRWRDGGNTLLHKQFPGGHLTLAGSNSPASLASRPIRVVLSDEVDRYPASAGNEGDPLALAEKRTLTFWNRKRIKVSTPTVKGISRIAAAYAESDQRRYFVPCPHCEQMQVLTWKQVQWPDDKPEEAAIFCVHCGAKWSEAERIRAVRAGKWRASAPFRGVAGFHISEIYSPWSSMAKMALDFVNAKSFPERLKTFINTSLGEVWDSGTNVMEPGALRQRAESYELGRAPAGALIITSGVDVQADRLEAYTWGYGEGEEAWCLDFAAFYGDPGRNAVWDQLREHLARPLEHELGALIVPRTVAIDSGGLHTQNVYAFVRQYGQRDTGFGTQRILAIKGASDQNKPVIGKPTPQDVNVNGDKVKHGVHLWPVGSFRAKQLIYARLGIDAPGRGYVHTTTALPDEFFDQIVSERLETKYIKGFPKLEWVLPPKRRNEALDCAVYAYAAACAMGLQRARASDWDGMRKRAAVKRETQTAAQPESTESMPEVTTPAPQPRRQPMPSRPNWTTSWRRK